MEALISPEQVISNVGTHTAPQRLLKKRYSVRIEFEQAGSLGNGRLVYFAVYCYYYEQSSLLNFWVLADVILAFCSDHWFQSATLGLYTSF